MSAASRSLTAVSTSPMVAAASYLGLFVLLLFAVISSLSDIIGLRSDVAAAAGMLEQLEGRSRANTAPGQPPMPTGSAYLEGATVTVAGATLLQRVSGAVIKAGGNVLSTQLDVPNASAKAGFISMVASSEIEQAQLQQVLYDLEAGMPFLFIDQLVVQPVADEAAKGADPGKLRVLLGVSGQWRGAK
ncbi:type II secretion system protein GspM [Bradyrhizobium elkanii]|uniref:type II secretion system protein GspM n=1 Tax=Bradyrhizobium elkanii TaxID=29448 RepID=UPI00209F93CA|nr:type II secretion system protein GspM [Bradyrhizobium elkanii]MCP1975187.1 general secretion pathway protein M [Bradyrhizobium elkanii]MCS3522303.1 general secretion pathway protein M [Bradyrhizobium elkanii]MCS4069957.1 general secretion pathway protein M [Bradyrhizobium elkanii]MCS4076588.1 general secretion pathway protein M [Bradyrhizobium elkanii]MCS4112431.1 general secretion pathway protein M [Bradyrhizobium elkanii]